MVILFYFSPHLTKGHPMKPMSEKQIKSCLDRINGRREILETGVRQVVDGFASALFVWGSPGLGKSHLLTTMLDALAGSQWFHHTAHSTPKALFLSLMEAPASVHLFEDCEKVLKTDVSASILRAACGAPNERTRKITYETAHETHRVSFTGGIIVATNENLSRKNGPMQGVASRFRPIRWELDLQERIAIILNIAKQGCVRNAVQLTAKECLRVAHDLIEMTRESTSPLDLDIRLYTEHALPAFAQAKGNPGANWKDLMQAKLLGVATTVEDSQEARTRKLQTLAQKIHLEGKSTKDRVAKWKELTNLGPAIFFRHLKSSKTS